MSTMVHPPDDCPVARLVGRDGVPAGMWSRPALLFPYAVTPLCADFMLGKHLPVSYRAAGEELSLLTPDLECVVVDGWVYTRLATTVDHPPERVAAFEAKVLQRYDDVLLRRWREQTRPAAIARLRRYQRLELHRLSDTSLLRHLHRLSDHATALLTAHNQNLVAAHQIIYRGAQFCEQQLGLGAAAFVDLLAGSSAASSAPVRRMEQLAAAVLGDWELRVTLASPSPWDNAAVRTLLALWLAEFGHRLPAFAYRFPTPAERPDQVMQLLREAVARQQRVTRPLERRVVSGQAAAALRERLDPAERTTFDRLLRDARAAYAVRDDTIGVYQWGEGLLRYALLDAGRRLSARRLLSAAERVWYLRRPEMEGALAGDEAIALCELAEHRYAEYQRQQAIQPPLLLRVGEPVRPPALPPLSDEAGQAIEAQRWFARLRGGPVEVGASEEGELRGAPASGGIYRGPARVIASEAEFDRVQPGDVLVCSTTSPTWNILFGAIGALVTDHGGMLSHPAIIAREFAHPAVVGTRGATMTIADGQLVEVDGTAGIVRW